MRSASSKANNGRSDGNGESRRQRFRDPVPVSAVLEHAHLRYARWDFSRVDLIVRAPGQILCPESVRSIKRQRRCAASASGNPRRTARNLSAMPATGIAPCEANDGELRRHRLPPAYLPREGRAYEPKSSWPCMGSKWNPFTPEGRSRHSMCRRRSRLLLAASNRRIWRRRFALVHGDPGTRERAWSAPCSPSASPDSPTSRSVVIHSSAEQT